MYPATVAATGSLLPTTLLWRRQESLLNLTLFLSLFHAADFKSGSADGEGFSSSSCCNDGSGDGSGISSVVSPADVGTPLLAYLTPLLL